MRKLIVSLLAFCQLALPVTQGGPIIKTPTEAINVAVNFAPVASNDGITLSSVKATDIRTNQVITSTIVAASPAPAVFTNITINGITQSGLFVVFRVQNGNNKQSVLLDVLVTDNVTGEVLDGQFTLNINSGLPRG